MIKNILIIVLGYFVWLAYFDEAHSANQENQYCDIKTTIVKTVDKDGKTVNEESKEIVECDDGVKHILQDAGIAKDCKFYNWMGLFITIYLYIGIGFKMLSASARRLASLGSYYYGPNLNKICIS